MADTKWRLSMTALTVVLCNVLPEVQSQTMPTGCSYNDGMFECSYETLNSLSNIPLNASLFDPIPQRLRLTNLPASLSTTVFAHDFTNLSSSSYDENYPATLELKCTFNSSLGSATLTLGSGFLTNMDHIEDFKIINCHLDTIPASVFAELGTLDRFAIENGSIVAMEAGMLNGITIMRNSSAFPKYPAVNGEFSIRHTKLYGNLPADLFSSQTSLYSVVLDGMELTSISSSQFSSNTNLRFISLGYNQLTEIPSGLFEGLNSLGEVRLYDTTVTCACDTLWFMTHAQENYISLYGDILCNNAEHTDKLALLYFHKNCVNGASSDCTGVELMGTCMTVIDLTANIIAIISLVMGCVILGLIIHMKKQMDPNSVSTERKKPPPYNARGRGPTNTKKGWA